MVDGHLPLGAADQGMDIFAIVDNLEGKYFVFIFVQHAITSPMAHPLFE